MGKVNWNDSCLEIKIPNPVRLLEYMIKVMFCVLSSLLVLGVGVVHVHRFSHYFMTHNTFCL